MNFPTALRYFDSGRDALQNQGQSVTVILYNALLKAAGKVYDTVEMERILQMMAEQGVRPSSVTYNILLHTFGELRQYEQVAARYHEMLESGIHPDGVTYSVLIAAA